MNYLIPMAIVIGFTMYFGDVYVIYLNFKKPIREIKVKFKNSEVCINELRESEKEIFNSNVFLKKESINKLLECILSIKSDIAKGEYSFINSSDERRLISNIDRISRYLYKEKSKVLKVINKTL